MSEVSKTVIWPNVFLTGEIEEDYSDAALCADAFIGWALCHSGNKPTANFGKGMAAISIKLNVVPTEDELTKLAKAKGWLK